MLRYPLLTHHHCSSIFPFLSFHLISYSFVNTSILIKSQFCTIASPLLQCTTISHNIQYQHMRTNTIQYCTYPQQTTSHTILFTSILSKGRLRLGISYHYPTLSYPIPI